MSRPLTKALSSAEVLVCAGAGGVGKTTVAAALALGGAMARRRSLVCTIDPARRLANALGVSELGNEETPIDPLKLEQAGLPRNTPLNAMMLDMKQTWDELIIRLVPEEKREKIFQNRFYQSLSSALAGSQEYIAMEKLCQLYDQRLYDLLVLDTPPAAHALDFLEAPNRVLDFLDNEAARWLLAPALTAGKVGLKLFNWSSSYLTKTLAKFTGAETLGELANFMLAIGGMNEDFRQRALEVRELVSASTTHFVLVTTAHPDRLEEVARFKTLLQQNHITIAAVVVNRVHAAPTESQWSEAERLPLALREKMKKTLEELAALAAQDATGLAEIERLCHPLPIVALPRLDSDVHDLAGLRQIARHLTEAPPAADLSASLGPP